MSSIDSMQAVINQIHAIHGQFEGIIDMWFLVFARLLGFVKMAPVFNRKDVPFNIKIAFAMIFAWVLLWTLPAEERELVDSQSTWWYLMQIFMNIFIGGFIGFIANVIMMVINAAGSLMNNQMALSSAMTFDPGTRKQVALFEKLFGFIALVIFINIGGIYWLINALRRTFEVFPLHSVYQDIISAVDVYYLIYIAGNTLTIGLSLVAPIFVVTMSVDLILGIVNRTAQQIQVFQLSFALKPSVGTATFLLTLPIFVRMVEHYLIDFSKIF